MECRIVLTHLGIETEVGMYDPQSGRYVPLGRHREYLDTVVEDLKKRMEREGHTVTFCER